MALSPIEKMRIKHSYRWFFCFSFILFLVALLLISLPPGEILLRRMAQAQLKKIFRQEVVIGKLETNLWNRLVLEDVQIFEDRSDRRTVLFSANRSLVRFQLFHLLKKEISVTELAFDSLYVHVQRDCTGQWNLPSPADNSKKSSPSAFRFHIAKCLLSHAMLVYQDQKLAFNTSLEDLNLNFHSPDFRIQSDSLKVTYQAYRLGAHDLTFSGSYEQRQLHLDSCAIAAQDLQLTGKATLDFRPDAPVVNAGLFLKGRLDGLAAQRSPGSLPSVRGDAALSCVINGDLTDPDVLLNFRSSDLVFSDIDLRETDIQLRWTGDSLQIRQFRTQPFDGEMTVKGYVMMDSLKHHRLMMDARNVNVASIWQAHYKTASPLSGLLKCVFRSDGPLQQPDRLNVLLDASMYHVYDQSSPVPDIVSHLQLKDGSARFQLTHEKSELSAEFDLQPDAWKGQFNVDVQSLAFWAAILNIPELDGRLEARGTLTGSRNKPLIRTIFTGSQIQFQNFPVDTLAGTVVFSQHEFKFSDVIFKGHCQTIDSTRAPFHLPHLGGGFEYHGRADGSFGNPQLTIHGRLFRPTFQDVHFDSGRVLIFWSGDSMHLSDLVLHQEALLVKAQGRYQLSSGEGYLTSEMMTIAQKEDTDFFRTCGRTEISFKADKTGDISVTARGDSVTIDKFSPFIPALSDFGGLLHFDLDLDVHQNQPTAELRLKIIDARHALVRFDSLSGEMHLKNGLLQLIRLNCHEEEHVSWARGSVQLTDQLRLTPGCQTRGQIKGESLDLGIANAFLPADLTSDGTLWFDLAWNGSVIKPNLLGTLAIENGAVFRGEGKPILKDLKFNASFQDTILLVEKASGFYQDKPIQFQGKLISVKDQSYDLQLSLGLMDSPLLDIRGIVTDDTISVVAEVRDGNLSDLQLFLPETFKLTGLFNGQLTVRGNPENPIMSGELKADDFGIHLHEANLTFDHGLARIRFDQQRVVIDSISSDLNGGEICLRGQLLYERLQLRDIALNAQITDVKIDRPDVAIVRVKSGRLNYEKNEQSSRLFGDIVLAESRMILDFPAQSLLPFVRKIEKPKPEMPSYIKETQLNLRIRDSDRIWIDNNLARLRLQTDLAILGTPVQINLIGKVTSKEGYLLYLDRKFNIQQGELNFADPLRINPIIDLKSVARLEVYQTVEELPYDITLTVKGPLDQASVELTSAPALEKSDIIALLTVGATRKSMTEKQKQGTGIAMVEIMRQRLETYSNQRLSSYASKKVGNLLGLERMSIEGNLFQFDRSWGPQLLASKRISDRVEIIYTTSVGRLNEQGIRLDYRLTKNISLQGQTDQEGRSGIDLKFGFKFK